MEKQPGSASYTFSNTTFILGPSAELSTKAATENYPQTDRYRYMVTINADDFAENCDCNEVIGYAIAGEQRDPDRYGLAPDQDAFGIVTAYCSGSVNGPENMCSDEVEAYLEPY